MNKYISLLTVVLGYAVCSSALAEQRAYGIDLCSEIVEFEGEAYFCGDHHRLGRELFRTNGTPEGTLVVADIDAGPGGSQPSGFFKLRGKLYFFAETTLLGRELWSTDGTEQGTKRIKDTFPGPDGLGSSPRIFQDNDTAYFSSRAGWWRTDGSSDGTVLILNYADEPSGYRVLGVANNSLYFQRELPYVNGLPAGGPLERIRETNMASQVIKDFGIDCFFRNSYRFSYAADLNEVQPIIFLEMNCFSTAPSPGVPGISLVASDGTGQGTRVVIRGKAEFLGELGDQHYYFNKDKAKIEYTDGVNTKTLGICAGPITCLNAFGEARFEVNGKMVFGLKVERLGDLTQVPDKVYSSDGTLSGTTEIAVGRLGSGHVTGGRASFFTADSIDSVFRRRMWTSDGSAGGTRLVPAFDSSFGDIGRTYSLGNHFIFFQRPVFNSPYILWRSNGLSLQKVFTFPSNVYRLQWIATEGHRLYFEFAGYVWHSDATEKGTYRLTYLEEVAALPPSDSHVFFMYPVLDLLLQEQQ